MQQQQEERGGPCASVGLHQHQRKRDLTLSLAFSSSNPQGKREAQRLRVGWWQRGQTTPAHGITTAHNAARFGRVLFPLMPVRECRRPTPTAREERIRKAKVALRYGQRYGTLSIGGMADALKILGARPDLASKKEALQQARNALESLIQIER